MYGKLQFTHLEMGWLFPHVAAPELNCWDFGQLSSSQADLFILVSPVQAFLKSCVASLLEMKSPSFLSSSKQLANLKGRYCSKAESWVEQVREGGKYPQKIRFRLSKRNTDL